MRTILHLIWVAVGLCSAAAINAQTNMIIHRSDGSVIQIPVNEIDSVTHSIEEPFFTAQVLTASEDCVKMESAVMNGELVNDGGAEVTELGFCWSLSPEPTIDDDVINVPVQPGFFSAELTGLTMETTYYVRAFAVNAAGVGYGGVLELVTPSVVDDFLNPGLNYDSVTDIDGNEYPTIVIGEQEWMAENLRVTRYSNGDLILVISDDESWEWVDEGACVFYNDDCNKEIPYGKYYNWHAVIDERNVCPTGWHVPTNDEWEEMTLLFGGMQAGGALKSAGSDYWFEPNLGATNESGLSLLPGGEREDNGFFNALGVMAAYWTATEYGPNDAFYRELSYGHTNIFTTFNSRQSGFSVRCVKD